MSKTADFAVRTASLEDAEAVSALLQASYPSLMALGYDPVLFARALTLLTKANPALLSSGTWYVVELSGADGALIGCGGWARQRPDAPNEPVDTVLGHLRHFATHPKWAGQQSDAHGIAPGHQPIAVVFDLVNPVRARRWFVGGRWEAGCGYANSMRKCCAAPF